MNKITELLLEWYSLNQRNLPWRKTSDPYKIWLSEIILQQTRVNQGYDYYLKFIRKFPDVDALARAGQDEVFKLWQGLGYYNRARNLHRTAKIIARDYGGKFPDDFKELLKLKGIGQYTASAIASIAFSKPFAVVDGNVIRFISRFFGVTSNSKSSKGLNEIRKKAEELIDKDKPGDFNQAVMEFGALICKPQNPACVECILSDNCYAYNSDKVEELPARYTKKVRKNRWFHYLVVINREQYFYLKKRTAKDIWQNLYEFLLMEVDSDMKLSDLRKTAEWKNTVAGSKLKSIRSDIRLYHKLSHQNLSVSFHVLKLDDQENVFDRKYIKTSLDQIDKYPVSKLISSFTEDFLKKMLF